MQNTLNWYILYTRPRSEKKVMTLLARNGVESYCPFQKIEKAWNRKLKTVEEPLFKCYVFARVPEIQLEELKQVAGVINILHWQEEPAVIPEVEIEMLKRFLFDFNNVKLERAAVNPEESMSVHNAPELTIGKKTIEVKYTDVKITLPSLGYSVVAVVEKSETEIITVLPGQQAATQNQRDATTVGKDLQT